MTEVRRAYVWELISVTPDGPQGIDVYTYRLSWSNQDYVAWNVSFYEHPGMLGNFVFTENKTEYGIHSHLLTSAFLAAKWNGNSLSKLTVRKVVKGYAKSSKEPTEES